MIIEKIIGGYYRTNCYIVIDEETKKSIIIDPGVNVDEIYKKINMYDLTVSYVILTHGHWDHLTALLDIKNKLKVPIGLHKYDEDIFCKSINKLFQNEKIEIDIFLEHGQNIKFGNEMAHIIHTPGHSPGSISIVINNVIISGDTLFKNNIGRTDLEGSNYDDIINSINNKILSYEDNMNVLPGHGTETLIGYERENNEFI